MNEAEKIWTNHKPMAIAGVIVFMAILYIIYKKAQSAIIAPPALAPTPATGPGGTFTTTYDTTTVNNPANPVRPIKSPVVNPPAMGKPTWLPAIPNGSKLIPGWGGLPWGWQAKGSNTINGLNPPTGTKIWQGSAGRWWYAVPGGPETLLTTS